MKKREPFESGTKRWWTGESKYGAQGIAESILRLYEQEEISRRKAVELIKYMEWRQGEMPDATWDKLMWSPPEGADVETKHC